MTEDAKCPECGSTQVRVTKEKMERLDRKSGKPISIISPVGGGFFMLVGVGVFLGSLVGRGGTGDAIAAFLVGIGIAALGGALVGKYFNAVTADGYACGQCGHGWTFWGRNDDPPRLKCEKCGEKRPVTGITRVVRKAGKGEDFLTLTATIGVVLFNLIMMTFALLVGLPFAREFGFFGFSALVVLELVFLSNAVRAVVEYLEADPWNVRFFRCDECGDVVKQKHLQRVSKTQ